MNAATNNGESKMEKSMKSIYADGIKLAKVLDSWKETGFVITTDEDIYSIAKAAINSANAILPGAALSYTLAVAESVLGTKDGEALENYLRTDLILTDTLVAELNAFTLSGAC
jgi:hypothetical protein